MESPCCGVEEPPERNAPLIGGHRAFCHMPDGDWRSSMLGGAGAGLFSRLVSAPFDVVKIRMQLDASRHGTRVKTRDAGFARLIKCTKDVYKEEGVVTFFRGNIPGLLMWIGYGAIQFPVFAYAQEALRGVEGAPNPVINFTAGFCAGATATVATHPLDVLRTRFAGQGLPKQYPSMASMVTGTGLKGSFQGLQPALLYVAPSMGITFSSYTFFRQHLPFVEGSPLFCGALAGFITKTLLYPLDISKKRLQLQGLKRNETVYGPNRQYTGMSNCIYKIVSTEGGIFRGLYKGFLPGVLKSVVSTAATFVFYEYISKRLL